jgi:hypothetical protein
MEDQRDLEKPRFRNDLVAQPIEEEGIRYVDVTDPNSGSTFRFYDVEYSIACAMDGSKDLTGLVEWTKGELGIDTSVDELQGVVSTLAELGYLEAAARILSEEEEADEFAYSEPTRNVSTDVMQQKAREAEARHADGTGSGGAPRAPGLPPMPNTKLEHDPRAKVPTRRLTPEPMNAVTGEDEDVDLDIDLSSHAKLTKEDVKEAVRASRVVNVPSVSKDLLDHIESEADQKQDSASPVTDVPKKSSATPLPKEPPKAVRPVETPSVTARSAEKKSSSGPLLIFLLLIVVGGGAFYYFTIYKPEHDQPGTTSRSEGSSEGSGTSPESGNERETPTEAARASAPEARLAEMGTGTVEAKSGAAGVIEWTADEGAQVEKDAAVAKLFGAKRFEMALTQATERQKFYQDELAKAQAAGNKAVAVNLQKKVAEKKALADAASAGLTPLLVKAPSAGTVQVLVGKGAKVNAGDAVARVNGGPALGAAFDAGKKAADYKAGDPCTVASKGDPDKQISCVVDAVDGSLVRVKVVGDAPVKAQESVLLVPTR